ncbi:radical SAM family heme chaperone HemW [Aquipuribacter nitratireducens]|uniref:Heme chaperone HemW n=1 Tax=Aquipuribacter nitratireducens TaxID=650104 RepID=A0ABW0GNH3_9MICO
MPGPAPQGEPAPPDGSLPSQVRDGAGTRRLGVYVHVPFCRVRCGYCDFTTYTAEELGPQAGATRAGYPVGVRAELDLARRVLDAAGLPPRPVSTVFLGGGTPTLLPARDLAGMLDDVRDRFGLADDAEVTTEANPDSVDAACLDALAAAGFTRVSFGVQSFVPHVLAALDRTHDPDRVPGVVAAAKAAGLHVSIDLIYGAPGETADDWARTLEAAVALEPDHVSAYALVVEPGTRLAVQVRRGEVAPPDDDVLADRYEAADSALTRAGLGWYEVSNWARTPAHACRHNLGYWRGDDWWGVGPGAHSHVGGVRWWNTRHPAAWAGALEAGRSPAQAREVLDPGERHTEDVLLRSRLVEGLPVDRLADTARQELARLVGDGLLDDAAARAGRVVPTLRGRLLSDVVARALTG